MAMSGLLLAAAFLPSASAHFPHGFLQHFASDGETAQLHDHDPYNLFCCTTESKEQTTEVKLEVERGTVPTFLQGDWIKMAGAQFEMGSRQVGHGFDAFAKLHKFRFTGDGSIHFSARFLGSKFYNDSKAAGDIVPGMLMGAPVPGFKGLDYAKAFLNIADNTVINPWALGEDSFVTTTDYALYNEFDRKTLAPRGHFPMEDSFVPFVDKLLHKTVPAFTGSHTQYIGGGSSPKKGRTSINWYGDLSPHLTTGVGMDFTVYRQLWGSRKREAISQTLHLDWVPVIHSFGVTSRHAIFLVHPLKMDLLGAMGSAGPAAMAAVKWDPSSKSKVLVLDLAGAEAEILPQELPALQVFELDAFFSVHHMNTYEEDGKLVTQCACYSAGDFFDPDSGVGFMAVERNATKRVNRGGDLHYCQVEVDLLRGTVVNKQRASGRGASGEVWGMEMPRYNDEWQGRKSCYVYGIAAPMNKTWQRENQFIQTFAKANVCAEDGPNNIVNYVRKLHYAWEPVFVPNGGPAEDDGFLLIVSMDAERKTSYVLIVDAKDMTELAVAYLPQGFVIPNGLHSRFFSYAEFPLPTEAEVVVV
jgi:carotenoid cleavage dioxygenase-like enzyme